MGKGVSGAGGDDTKTLKSAVLEWLVPSGQAHILSLSWNIKSDSGFNNEVMGALLCLAGLDWSNAEWVLLLFNDLILKSLARTKQSLKSCETTVCGDQWPMFLYAGYVY
jgi:hypothetical protein